MWIIAGVWSVLILFSSYLGIFRTLVDRIRSGLSASPTKTDQISKLITTSLTLPNHERPFHVEASFLSSFQVLVGYFFLHNFLANTTASYLIPVFLLFWWKEYPHGFTLAKLSNQKIWTPI